MKNYDLVKSGVENFFAYLDLVQDSYLSVAVAIESTVEWEFGMDHRAGLMIAHHLFESHAVDLINGLSMSKKTRMRLLADLESRQKRFDDSLNENCVEFNSAPPLQDEGRVLVDLNRGMAFQSI